MKNSKFWDGASADTQYSKTNSSDEQELDESGQFGSNNSKMDDNLSTRKRKASVYAGEDDYSGPESSLNGQSSSDDEEVFSKSSKSHRNNSNKNKKKKGNTNNSTNNKSNKKKRKYHKRARTAAEEVNEDDDIDEEDANDDQIEEDIPDDFGDTTSSSKSDQSSEEEEQKQFQSLPIQYVQESNKQKEVPLIQEIIGVKDNDTPGNDSEPVTDEEFQDETNTLYYVKWTGLSYIHCSYLKKDQILCISGGSSALKKYKTKINRGFGSLSQSLSIPNLMTLDDNISANYFEVDRIIGKRLYHFDKSAFGNAKLHDFMSSDDNGHNSGHFTDLEDFTNVPEILYSEEKNREKDGKVQYFIKWRSQGYDESTWEFEEDVPSAVAIEQYENRHKLLTKEYLGTTKVVQACWNSTKIIDNPRTVDPKTFSELSDPLSDSDGNTLRDYQVEGFNWLRYCWYHRTNSILADEMGLGKTLQVVSALNDIYVNHGIHGPFFVIAPLSTLPHWKNEIERWTKMNAVIYHGNSASRDIIRRYEMFDYVEKSAAAANENQPQTENESGAATATSKSEASEQVSDDYISRSEDNEDDDENNDDDDEYINKSYKKKHKSKSSSSSDLNSDLICDKSHVCFDILITNYETFMMDYELFSSIEWHYLVLDEGHRLKNHSGKCYKLLKKLKFEHCTLLTGTPVQNNVEELWSLLHFLDRNKFKDLSAFMEEYGVIEDASKLNQLQMMLKPYLLRRKKSDVDTTIAAKEETIIEVELTRVQKSYYRAFLSENSGTLLQKITGGALPSLLNLMMQLRKVCNHPFLIRGATSHIEEQVAQKLGKPVTDEEVVLKSLVESSGKLILIDKLLPKLREGGHKVLIFSQMVKILDILEDYLSLIGIKPERIDGSVPEIERQNAIERFATDPNAFVFLLCTRAGGVGINLTAADTVIIYDSDWNPQNDIQAESRCHRIGQKAKVKVYRLVTRGTYELEMLDRASKKLGLDRAILDGGTFNKKQSPMAANEIEKLLRSGAYSIAKDDDKIDEFCAANIDQILERSKSFTRDVSDGGDSLFSKASFNANPNDSTDSKDFWSVVLPAIKPEDDIAKSERKCKSKPMRFNESDDEDVKRSSRKMISNVTSPRGVAGRIMHDGYKGSAKEKALLLYAASEVQLSEDQQNILMKILGVNSLTEKSDDVLKAEKKFSPSLDEYTDKKETVIHRTIFFYQLNQVMTFIQDPEIDSWPKTETGANPIIDYSLMFGILKNGIGMQSRVLDGVTFDGTMPNLTDKMIQKIGKIIVAFFIDDAKDIEHFPKKYLEPNEWRERHFKLFNRDVMKNEEFQTLFQTITLIGFIEKKNSSPTKVDAKPPISNEGEKEETVEKKEDNESNANDGKSEENEGKSEENDEKDDDDEKKKEKKFRVRLKAKNEQQTNEEDQQPAQQESEPEIDWPLIRKYAFLDCISLQTVIEMGTKIQRLASNDLSDAEMDEVMSRLGQYGNKVWVSKMKSTIRDIQKIRLFAKRYNLNVDPEPAASPEKPAEDPNENPTETPNENPNENSNENQPANESAETKDGEQQEEANSETAKEELHPTYEPGNYYLSFPYSPEFKKVVDKLGKMKQWDLAPVWWSVDQDLGLIKAINDFGLIYVTSFLVDPLRPFFTFVPESDRDEFFKAAEAEKLKSRPQKPRDPGEFLFMYNDKPRLQRANLVIQFVDSQLQKSKRYDGDSFGDYKSDASYRSTSRRGDLDDGDTITELPSMPLELSSQVTVLDLGQYLSSSDSYPVGYRVNRQYFSIKNPREKSWYEAYTKINDDGKFRYVVKHMSEPEKEFEAHTASGVWENVIKEIEEVKGKLGMPKRKFISVSGPLMFGFSSPIVAGCFKLMKAQADSEGK